MNTPYSIYQGIENKRKIYIAISRWAWAGIKPADAIKIANQHFKVKASDLKCEKGYIVNNELYLGETNNVHAHNVWVVTRK